jgi:predicted metal-dependent phosphoesterase TrpH
MRVDLHLHSTASDGGLSPSALVWAARAGGLHVISLTDHDTTAGYAEACAAGMGHVHVVPGIEVSTTHEFRELHMLGYYVDPGHPALRAHETEAVSRRRDRMSAMLDALRDGGVSVAFDDVAAEAGGAGIVARPHLARVLVQRGHAQSVSEAFERWIGNACPAYRPVNLVTPAEAIERIHAAGGIAVWAHPEMDVLRRDLRRFATWGMDGVECYRPRCPAEESLELERGAKEFGLYVTGGSDWHGSWNGRLGTFSLGRDEIGDVLERGGI